MKNRLQFTFQDVDGGKTHSAIVGWGLLGASINGNTRASFEVDNFEGEGDTYEERKVPQIIITAFSEEGKTHSWVGTADDLLAIFLRGGFSL